MSRWVTKWLLDGTGIKLSKQEVKILECIKLNPWCSVKTIARYMKVTREYVDAYLRKLFSKGPLRKRTESINKRTVFVYRISYNAKGIV